jgi:nucleolar protein 4
MVGKGRAPPSTAQQDQQRSQVFVRNLPLTLLEPELEALFGEHGPLKRIDLIKTTDQDGIKTSKGFAFIKFALEGDAARAVAAVNGQRVQGRVISAEIALKKGAKQNDSSSSGAALTPAAAKAAASKPTDNSDDSEGESGDDEGGHAPAATAVSAKQPKAAAKPVTAAAVKAVAKPAAAAAKQAAAVKPAAAAAKAAASTATANTTAGATEQQSATAAAAPPAKEVPQNVRTVLIYGVARDLGKNALRKRLRKATTIESVSVNDTETTPADDAALPRGCTATVVCVSREGPKKLIDKLDGHTIHSSRIHIRRLLETPPAGEAHAGSGLLKKHRLIVRNLPWAAAEEQLIEAFNAFGPLAEVHIPRYVLRSYIF